VYLTVGTSLKIKKTKANEVYICIVITDFSLLNYMHALGQVTFKTIMLSNSVGKTNVWPFINNAIFSFVYLNYRHGRLSVKSA